MLVAWPCVEVSGMPMQMSLLKQEEHDEEAPCHMHRHAAHGATVGRQCVWGAVCSKVLQAMPAQYTTIMPCPAWSAWHSPSAMHLVAWPHASPMHSHLVQLLVDLLQILQI